MMMGPFNAIRERVSAQEAAERYGVSVKRGKAQCIWHSPDNHPSLSFKDGYCRCFSCANGGSSIDLTMRLFGLTPKEAAAKLNEDFSLGLDMNRSSIPPSQITVSDTRRLLKEFQNKRWSKYCNVSRAAQAALEDFKDQDTAWDTPQFVEALRIKVAAETELEQMKLMDAEDWIHLYRKEASDVYNGERPGAIGGFCTGTGRGEAG